MNNQFRLISALVKWCKVLGNKQVRLVNLKKFTWYGEFLLKSKEKIYLVG